MKKPFVRLMFLEKIFEVLSVQYDAGQLEII